MPTQQVNYPEQINYFAYSFINGLDINYSASGSISVQPGMAYVSGLNKVVFVTGAITQNIPIVSTNSSGSWQNIYLGESGGIPFIQVTGTNPATPYSGVARSKTGDSTLRYLGSVYCDTGGYLYRFGSNVHGNIWRVNWIEAVNVFPFQFANVSGTVTNPTAIVLSWIVPTPLQGIICDLMVQNVHNLVTTGDNIMSISDVPAMTVPGNANIYAESLTRMNNGAAATTNVQLAPIPVKISGSQLQYTHINLAGTNGGFFRVRGYNLQR